MKPWPRCQQRTLVGSPRSPRSHSPADLSCRVVSWGDHEATCAPGQTTASGSRIAGAVECSRLVRVRPMRVIRATMAYRRRQSRSWHRSGDDWRASACQWALGTASQSDSPPRFPSFTRAWSPSNLAPPPPACYNGPHSVRNEAECRWSFFRGQSDALTLGPGPAVCPTHGASYAA